MKAKWFRRMLAGAVTAALCCGLAGCGGQNYQPTDALYINTPSATWIASYYNKGFKEQHENIAFSADGDLNQYWRFRRWQLYNLNTKEEIGEELQAYYDNLQMSLMKAKASDIVEIDNFYWDYDVTPLDYTKMAKAGAFVNLYDLWEQLDYDASGYNRKVLSSMEIDGNLYYMPHQAMLLGFTTTHKVMEENDFALDAGDTAIEFLRKCAAWKEAHPDGPEVFSSAYWTYLYQYWYMLTGSDVVDFTAQKVSFETDEVKELLSLIKALRPSDYDPDTIYDVQKISSGRLDSYNQRKYLFADYYTADQQALESGDYLMLMPIRQNDGTTMAFTTNTLKAIPSNAENVYNAGLYLTYYIESDNEEIQKNGYEARSISMKPAEDRTRSQTICDQNQVDEKAYSDVLWDALDKLDQFLVPQSWMYTMRSYFDDYCADKISVDELTRVLQEKMEIYITE